MSKLKKILKERKMTQTELVELTARLCKTPVPRYTVNKICKGNLTNFSVNTLIKICRALEVTPNEILSKSNYNSLFKKR